MNSTPSLESWIAAVRPNCTLNEVVVLGDVPESLLRKDIENGRVYPRHRGAEDRLWFKWVDVLSLTLVYKTNVFTPAARHSLWTCLARYDDEALFRLYRAREFLQFAKYVKLDVCEAIKDASPRVKTYTGGLNRIEEKSEILGGEPVFRHSRIPVRHVGEIADKGEELAHILQDFPGLTPQDVEFARLYFRANPPVGRPRNRGGPPRDATAAIG